MHLFDIIALYNDVLRLEYRQEWDADFRQYLQKLDNSKPVILCGDLNVSHLEIGIDLCDTCNDANQH